MQASQQSSQEQQWSQFRQFLSDNLGTQQFTAWFSDVHFVRFENKNLYISVQSDFFVQQFETRFNDVITSAIKKVYGEGVALFFVYNQIQGQKDTAVESRSSGLSTAIVRDSAAPAANPFIKDTPKKFNSQLNPRYNFENYCKGQSNLLACALAESIANDPSNKTFNPLFVFGPTGVGKTHLIQAVGIRIKENNPEARVLYITARLFQVQFTAANHNGKINDFFHFYQNIDTLIVDDVQDLAGKGDTQNTFFHIFNQLQQNNRQIILSSDCAPSEMDGFEARLLNRFKWGAIAPLEKPDFELRRQVLRKKAEQDGLSLPEEVIEYVAENVTDSIRELEGVVASIVAHATVVNSDITLDLARIVVANAVRLRRSQVNFEMISQAVASYFKLSPDAIFSKTRKREISDARQIIMYLSKKMVGMSLKSIGNKLGRNHATVIYGCKLIEDRLEIDKELRGHLEGIKAILEET